MVIHGTNDSPVLGNIAAIDMMETDLTGIDGHSRPENSYIIGTLPDVEGLVSDEDQNDTHEYVRFGQFMDGQTPVFVNVMDAGGAVIGNAQIRLESDGEYRVFNPSYNNLAAGETATITFGVQVTDGTSQGENPDSNTQMVTITVMGTNDRPVVQDVNLSIAETDLADLGIYEEARYENTLTSTDEDASNTNPKYQIGNVEVSNNTAGILASHVVVALTDANANGWSANGNYTVTSTMFNGLAEGESVTISFDYRADDREGFGASGDGVNEASKSTVETITLTITGTNDEAVISPYIVTGDIYEVLPNMAHGMLGISDEDFGQAMFDTDPGSIGYSATHSEATPYGTFTMFENGLWTYSLDQAKAQSLGDETVQETYTVQSADGSADQPITITIYGNDDAPTVTSHAIGSNIYTTYTNSTDMDIPGGEDSKGTINSTIYVPDSAVVADLNVDLTLTHTWDSDLDIYLIAPDGTKVELTTDNGGSGDNFTNTTFDDEAGTSITSGTAPFTGTFRPEGDLSDFDGMDMQGTWTLQVTDDYEWDTGILDSWSLDFTSQDQVLSVNDVDAGTIDLVSLLDSVAGDAENSVDAIELNGKTELNISIVDVVDITDGDNELVISSDGGNNDTITLDTNITVATNQTGTPAGYTTYEGGSGANEILLTIEDNITVEY